MPNCCFHREAKSGEFSFKPSAEELNTETQTGLSKCQWKTRICGSQVVDYRWNSKIGKGLTGRICSLCADNMAGAVRERGDLSAFLHLQNKKCKKIIIREDTHRAGDLRARCKSFSL